MTSVKWLGTAYAHPDDVPPDQSSRTMQTRDEYETMVRERSARDKLAPKVGDPAPAFIAEHISPSGSRTGNMFRLSKALGRPVALVFGSYT